MHPTNVARIEQAVRTILECIGENPNREGLRDTPKRVAKMYQEIFSGLTMTNADIIKSLSTVFTEEENEDVADKFGDMVIVKNIPFYSSCEHHLIPFFGKAHVGYVPNQKIIGLSKIARLVDIIGKRPQVQERITKDVADIIVQMLDPIGVMVVIEAEHLCMNMRGVKKPGTSTVTSATRGCFDLDPTSRNEFLSLIRY